MLVFSNTCRFCLILVGKETVSLFCSDSSVSLPRKIMDIADIQVSEEDGLPNVICPSCFAQLELSHQFKLQVEKADKILREEINLNAILPIESEIVEYDDETVKCENVQTENTETDTNCVIQEDVTGETLNRPNEENINTELSCESETSIDCQKDLNNDATCYNNSAQKETNSGKQKFKGQHQKYNTVYKCELCDASFKLKHMLNFHRLAFHGHHKCKKCNKVFPSRPEMENHRRIHLNERQLPVACTTCGKVYKSKPGLKFHMHRQHSIHLPEACTACGKVYTTKKYLKFHIKRQHSDYLPVACTTCGKVYKSKEGLQLHIRKQHTDNVRPYMCEICGKRFTDRPSLWSHKFSHTEGKQPVTCEVCNKTYPHDYALKVHKRLVHLVSKRIHCDVCGKDFKSQQILKNHKGIHSGERPYICRICGFASAWKTAVRTHMKVHTGLESYSCEHCGQGFKWKQTFEKHVLKCFETLHVSKTKNTETSSTNENLSTAD